MSYSLHTDFTLLTPEEASDGRTAYGSQAPTNGDGCCSGPSAALTTLQRMHCSAAALRLMLACCDAAMHLQR